MSKIILTGSQALYGDIISFLPVLNYLEKLYPKSIKIWSLAKKCEQARSFLQNHHLIDGVRISQPSEGLGQEDIEYIDKKFDIVCRINPPISEENWFNKYNLRQECFLMYGFGLGAYEQLSDEEKFPKLNQWFSVEKQENYIAIWSSSGYVMDPANLKRNPSKEYWFRLVERLVKEGYKIAQLGMVNHELISDKVLDLRSLTLFDAIRFSLECQCSIQTDSGSAHILGAYAANQILLTTYWRDGHFQNPDGLIPVNYKNRAINMFCESGVNNIQYDKIVEGIKILNE